MSSLPPVSSPAIVLDRLQHIFPEGTPNRRNCTNEVASKTVFVMLYVGAVEGRDAWLRPNQVTRMTDEQAEMLDPAVRESWTRASLQSEHNIPGRWYAVDTRESIRDDTVRYGLIPVGAVVERSGLATTSSAPRYALKTSFAALFDPALDQRQFEALAANWQSDNLTPAALARITIVRKGGIAGGDHVLVTFPSGETRRMAPGQSSLISKAVIEDFSRRFLEKPALISLSESKDKVILRDDEMARAIGLNIAVDRALPDIVMADLGPQHPILVFIEVVATDGPITSERKVQFAQVAHDAGFPIDHVAFVTAYLDRGRPAFKKTINALAWGTYVWFASEPEHLLCLHQGGAEPVKRLSDLQR